jgi:hypothetical protein
MKFSEQRDMALLDWYLAIGGFHRPRQVDLKQLAQNEQAFLKKRLGLWGMGTGPGASVKNEKRLKRALHDKLERIADERSRRINDQYTPWKDRRLMADKVEKWDFSTRTMNILRKANIQTIGELVRYGRKNLSKIRGCGRKTLNDIHDRLAPLLYLEP